MEWQDIKTAPLPPLNKETWWQDSFRCLIVHDGYATIGKYSYTKAGKGRWQNEAGRNCKPTHWMPLPEPPSAG